MKDYDTILVEDKWINLQLIKEIRDLYSTPDFI